MRIDDNEQALATMQNFINSSENIFRSLYNYGFKEAKAWLAERGYSWKGW